jgi:hypothetical protein
MRGDWGAMSCFSRWVAMEARRESFLALERSPVRALGRVVVGWNRVVYAVMSDCGGGGICGHGQTRNSKICIE